MRKLISGLMILIIVSSIMNTKAFAKVGVSYNFKQQIINNKTVEELVKTINEKIEARIDYNKTIIEYPVNVKAKFYDGVYRVDFIDYQNNQNEILGVFVYVVGKDIVGLKFDKYVGNRGDVVVDFVLSLLGYQIYVCELNIKEKISNKNINGYTISNINGYEIFKNYTIKDRELSSKEVYEKFDRFIGYQFGAFRKENKDIITESYTTMKDGWIGDIENIQMFKNKFDRTSNYILTKHRVKNIDNAEIYVTAPMGDKSKVRNGVYILYYFNGYRKAKRRDIENVRKLIKAVYNEDITEIENKKYVKLKTGAKLRIKYNKSKKDLEYGFLIYTE